MHVPNPLGSYPLQLRDYDTSNPKRGELLLDYDNFDLYYIHRKTGERINVAEDIWRRIMELKLQNIHIDIVNADKLIPTPSEKEIIPPRSERHMNHWYYRIMSRVEEHDKEMGKIILDDTACYVINDQGIKDPDGHELVVPDGCGYMLSSTKLLLIGNIR